MQENLAALRRLDLNLLLTFDTLLSTRSATKAAVVLHKTQPGISRDLAKLRHAFDDALLVPVKGRFVPTERALALHDAVSAALRDLGKALAGAETFEPAQVTGVVNIGLAAHLELLLTGPLLQRLAQRAPGVTPIFHSIHGEFDPGQLDSESQDIAIGLFADVPARFSSKALFSDERVAVMGPRHAFAGRKQLTLDDMDKARWFAYTQMHGRRTNFDRALKGTGRRVRFEAYIASFELSPHVLMESDYATTMPAFAAILHKKTFPLATSRLPRPLRHVTFRMAWPRRQDASPMHRWLRAEITQLVTAHIESGLIQPCAPE
ncbi:MAG: LysR family transcriptional regulator [Comamonadaceae bacterium]|nr:LysR family transcriptional regulator [Comamonadaceae bacterium]